MGFPVQQFLCFCNVPDFHRPERTATDEPFPVATEAQTIHVAIVPFQRGEPFPIARIPEHNVTVVAGRGDALAIGAVRDRGDGAIVSEKDEFFLPA